MPPWPVGVASHDWHGISGTATLSSFQRWILPPQSKSPVFPSFWTTRRSKVVSRNSTPSWASRARSLKAVALFSTDRYGLASHFDQTGAGLLPSQISTACLIQAMVPHNRASELNLRGSTRRTSATLVGHDHFLGWAPVITSAENAFLRSPPISSTTEGLISPAVFTGQSDSGNFKNSGPSCQTDPSASSSGDASLVRRSASSQDYQFS